MRTSAGIVLMLLAAAWPLAIVGAQTDDLPNLPADVCVPHPAIDIIGNEGPTGFVIRDPITGTALPRPGSGVLLGSGTPDDPYIIENWCISSDDTTGLAGIHLQDTDAHVVVRNNVVDFSSAAGGHGIRLRNAENVVITYNAVEGATYDAVRLEESSNNLVANNSLILNGWYGVGVTRGSHHNVIEDNYMAFNALYGMYLINGAHTNIVRHNHFEYNVAGLRFFNQANNNLIENNIFTNNDYGVYHTVQSFNSVFRGNHIVDNNEAGFVNAVRITLDARENWWGCADGPGAPECDGIDLTEPGAGVNTDPWLQAPNPSAGPRV